jgi:hypothetical protein
MLRPAIDAAVQVVVSEVPVVVGVDRFTAAPAGDVAGLDERPVLFAQRPVVDAVSALGGGAASAPLLTPAFGTTTGPVLSQRPGRAWCLIHTDAWSVKAHNLILFGHVIIVLIPRVDHPVDRVDTAG